MNFNLGILCIIRDYVYFKSGDVLCLRNGHVSRWAGGAGGFYGKLKEAER